jgi:hypothetical protein
MPFDPVKIAHFSISRLVIGGNPFSGFSHQSPQKDLEMRRYYTVERIKETLRQAEALGVNTVLARADAFIQRVLFEYWEEEGTIQWLAQTCPEFISISRSIAGAVGSGAKGCYLHGGQMDYLYAQRQLAEVPSLIAQIRGAGLAAGVAAHNPRVIEWAEEHLDVDFYMTAYYNPTPRDERAEHNPQAAEVFDSRDREAMVQVIHGLSKPAIHYKIFAAGRNDPRTAFEYTARHLRPQDAVCVGVFPKDNPRMIEEDLRLLEEAHQSIQIQGIDHGARQS